MISSKGICSTQLQCIKDCCYCSESVDNGDLTVTLTKKGCRNINSISQTLDQCAIQVKTGQCVHKKCRLDFDQVQKKKKQEAGILIRTKEQLSLASHVDPTETARTTQASCTDPTGTAGKARSQLVTSAAVSRKTTFLHRYNLMTSKRNPEIKVLKKILRWRETC